MVAYYKIYVNSSKLLAPCRFLADEQSKTLLLRECFCSDQFSMGADLAAAGRECHLLPCQAFGAAETVAVGRFHYSAAVHCRSAVGDLRPADHYDHHFGLAYDHFRHYYHHRQFH